MRIQLAPAMLPTVLTRRSATARQLLGAPRRVFDCRGGVIGGVDGTRSMVNHGAKSTAPNINLLYELKGDITHDMMHFKVTSNVHPLGTNKLHKVIPDFWDNPMSHPIWTESEIKKVEATHCEPVTSSDRLALKAANFCRWVLDAVTGYKRGVLTERKVLNRAIFLETISAVPGMTAGMLRHLRSLRRMDYDHGWIHTLLEEAENERMHLLMFITLKENGALFRLTVLGTQGIFMNLFFISYSINPSICHRFSGYLYEEAVRSYTELLGVIDNGAMEHWKTARAPAFGINYWHLKKDATMRDLISAIRTDEAHHRDVNHAFADMQANDDNPYVRPPH